MSDSPSKQVLDYASGGARVSVLAKVALGVAILGALTFFLVIPSVVALVLGIIADWRIRRHPEKLGGRGFATAAVTVSTCSVFLFLGMLVLLPSGHHSRESYNRSACAANLRGIVNSMVIYAAQNNDQFPVVTYASYSPALNSPSAVAVSENADDVIKSYYKEPYPHAGSVMASLWMMVLVQDMSPKLFVCKSDTAISAPAELLSGSDFYNNFQNDTQISYSAAYPWKADGTVGKWWSNTENASLPLLADMAPEQGTGKPMRYLTPAATPRDGKTWNSGNHDGDGQNVAYADVHVDYIKRPDVGQDGDNIWTTSGRPSVGPAEFGGIPAVKASPGLTRDAPPYDIIMYPIRNLDTGRL